MDAEGNRDMIAAIDPSLCNTAVVIGLRAVWESWVFRSEPINTGKLKASAVVNRMARADGLLARIVPVFENRPVEAIYLEGYAISANKAYKHDAVEYGGLLRWHLSDLEGVKTIREVMPTTLKKFTTGDHRASKAKMAAYVGKRWGQTFETEDETDAYALWRLAHCCEGIFPCETDEQWETCKTVLSATANRPRIGKPQLDLLLRS